MSNHKIFLTPMTPDDLAAFGFEPAGGFGDPNAAFGMLLPFSNVHACHCFESRVVWVCQDDFPTRANHSKDLGKNPVGAFHVMDDVS